VKHLPDPRRYQDPIRYFRDSHGIINDQLAQFETLLAEIASIGLEQSFKKNEDLWKELLQFFKRSGPRHEREEEQTLFPVLSDKLPSIGFKSPNDPSKFLSAEHFEMKRLTSSLTDLWKEFQANPVGSLELTANFQRTGEHLLAIYRQHIAKENEIIYKLANEELLTPDERESVMDGIVVLNSPQSSTAIFNYDQSDFSDASKSDNASDFTDAIGEVTSDSD